MALTDADKAKLTEMATRAGVDPAKAISYAEAELAATAAGAKPAPPKGGAPEPIAPPTEDQRPGAPTLGAENQPKLFGYHLPFVTVGEIRRVWLGLKDPLDPARYPGADTMVCAEFAAKFGGGGPPQGGSFGGDGAE